MNVSGPEYKTLILSSSLAHFPRLINTCSLEMIRVPTLRENTLLRVSPLLFLNHFRVFDFIGFYFVFGADFEDLATRGLLATVEQSLR